MKHYEIDHMQELQALVFLVYYHTFIWLLEISKNARKNARAHIVRRAVTSVKSKDVKKVNSACRLCSYLHSWALRYSYPRPQTIIIEHPPYRAYERNQKVTTTYCCYPLLLHGAHLSVCECEGSCVQTVPAVLETPPYRAHERNQKATTTYCQAN